MNWTRSRTIALASQGCSSCLGLGLRSGRGGRTAVCNCVLRAIFRACHNKFRYCAMSEPKLSMSDIRPRWVMFARGRGSSVGGPPTLHRYGYPKAEFAADFLIVAERTLGVDTPAYRLFKWHYLYGADWKQCCPRLDLDRGAFFHECYRVEQKLGRAFAETRPYGLWPLDEYFSACSGNRNALGAGGL
jgi:hypothetical protein